MSKVLSISTDRRIFEEGSAVFSRTLEYAELFEELHVVVFSLAQNKFEKKQIAPNCFINPTNSSNKFSYIFDAISIGRKIIKDRNFEQGKSVVTCQDPFETGLVGLIIKLFDKIPLHIQIHTDFLSPFFSETSFLNKLRVWISKIVLPKSDAIRVVSDRIALSLKTKNYKIKTNPVVLPIFTDLDKFKIAKPLPNFKNKYPDLDFVILVVARLSKEKRVDLAIDIFARLLKKYPRIGMIIVGEGPEQSVLVEKVKKLGLSENVIFEGWQDDLSPYYKTANLFLQTSSYEGFGLSLLEAAASGCPVVSSDVGIAPELLNHKGRSFICNVGDEDCFVLAISQLIENPQEATFFSWQIAPEAILPFVKTKKDYLNSYRDSIESSNPK